MKTKFVFIYCILSLLGSIGFGQIQEGEIASNFTLQKHGSDEEISLYDYEGKVIVLDFFAYWCGPCQTSSPELETQVAEFYTQQGGSQNGVPVTVLAISIDNTNPGAVNTFVANAGLKLVGQDMTGSAWRQFGTGYIPHFAVVNGVKDANFEQWEVLHSNYGYRGANFYKNSAEQVIPHSPENELSAFEEWVAPLVADSGQRGTNDDPDNDGMSNLYEYASGTNPGDRASQRKFRGTIDSQGRYALQFPKSKSATGISSVIQYSTDMVQWINYTPSDGEDSETDMGDFIETELRPATNVQTSHFFRRLVTNLSPESS